MNRKNKLKGEKEMVLKRNLVAKLFLILLTIAVVLY